KAIPSAAKDGALFGILLGAIAAAAYVCIPFYFAQGNLFGIFVGAMFAWLVLFIVLSLQWFVALRSLLHNSFKKCIKKCFFIFFDNVGFSIFMAVYNLFLVIISVLLFGMLPSFAGITLAQVNALRLRLYKYDYLETHSEFVTAKERKRIPWAELLANDKEIFGKRSFKSLIFPWKEM
ncbi:MAG: hypothetical protein J6I73_10360, partial [Treponema sp.]|nr:hypothetical protein [Treponema sp.]